MQVELMRMFGALVGVGHLGYRGTGNVPGYAAYRNPVLGEIGGNYRAAPALEIGAFVDVRELIGRLGSLREATLYMPWRDGGQRIQNYVTRGFAPASPDWAVGVTFCRRF